MVAFITCHISILVVANYGELQICCGLPHSAGGSLSTELDSSLPATLSLDYVSVRMSRELKYTLGELDMTQRNESTKPQITGFPAILCGHSRLGAFRQTSVILR